MSRESVCQIIRQATAVAVIYIKKEAITSTQFICGGVLTLRSREPGIHLIPLRTEFIML